jgi:transcription antitermination protein NusB
MSNRHLARTLAMQSLYQWDFLKKPADGVDKIIGYIRNEFAPEFDDHDYVESTVRGVIDHSKDIDEKLTQFAPDWPIENMTLVDRNILRIGVYELVYNQNIPSKVAINEAIEIAKSFGGETSGKFVNGVLGAIFKDQMAAGVEKEADKVKPESETAGDAEGAGLA